MDGLLDERYELIEPTGSGAAGPTPTGLERWKAHDRRLDRPVVVQRRPQLTRDQARAAIALNHPNLVTVHDSGIDATGPYLVTELVTAPTLAESAAMMPVERILTAGADVADGLTAARAAGVDHPHLGPDTVFITDRGAVVDQPGFAGSSTLGRDNSAAAQAVARMVVEALGPRFTTVPEPARSTIEAVSAGHDPAGLSGLAARLRAGAAQSAPPVQASPDLTRPIPVPTMAAPSAQVDPTMRMARPAAQHTAGPAPQPPRDRRPSLVPFVVIGLGAFAIAVVALLASSLTGRDRVETAGADTESTTTTPTVTLPSSTTTVDTTAIETTAIDTTATIEPGDEAGEDGENGDQGLGTAFLGDRLRELADELSATQSEEAEEVEKLAERLDKAGQYLAEGEPEKAREEVTKAAEEAREKLRGAVRRRAITIIADLVFDLN